MLNSEPPWAARAVAHNHRKDPKVFEDTSTKPAKTDVNFINYESGLSVAVMQEGFSIEAHRRLCAKRELDPGRSNVRVPDAKGEV